MSEKWQLPIGIELANHVRFIVKNVLRAFSIPQMVQSPRWRSQIHNISAEWYHKTRQYNKHDSNNIEVYILDLRHFWNASSADTHSGSLGRGWAGSLVYVK